MQPLLKSSLLVALVSLVGAACGGPQESASETKLIGGTAIDPLSSGNPYPATIYIIGNCTAAKIGPKRFLTAAHCVTSTVNSILPDGERRTLDTTTILSMFQPGATIVITSGKNPAVQPGTWKTLTIKEVHLNPTWGSGCTDRADCDFDVPSRFGSDIAAFDVNEETPEIATATLDFSRVNPGDRVVITGYGCEAGVGTPLSFTRRFKFSVNEARPLEELNRVFGTDLRSPFRFNIATAGVSTNPGGASLCPGDSGGPLYRDDGTEKTLVGVNAYYDFLERGSPTVSAYNWHTRLDRVQTWLESLPAGT